MSKTPVRLLIACAVALTALAVQSSALAQPLDGLAKTWSAGVPTVARGLGAPSACPESNFPPGGLCGSVTVPLDRANPGTGTIDVAYQLYPATDTSAPAVSTIVVSAPDGPGISVLAVGPDRAALRGRHAVLRVKGQFYPAADDPFVVRGTIGGRRVAALVDVY